MSSTALQETQLGRSSSDVNRQKHGKSFVNAKRRTKQEFRDECDIGMIVKRLLKTGIAPQMKEPPMYGDFTQVEDYQTAVSRINEAAEDFAKLPALTREYFGNDPMELIEFLSDPNNQQRAYDLGLSNTEPEPTPEPTPVPPKKEVETPQS